ncbi:hypothetical protein [Nonomuraea sp. NPDC005650]
MKRVRVTKSTTKRRTKPTTEPAAESATEPAADLDLRTPAGRMLPY